MTTSSRKIIQSTIGKVASQIAFTIKPSILSGPFVEFRVEVSCYSAASAPTVADEIDVEVLHASQHLLQLYFSFSITKRIHVDNRVI